MNDERLGGGGLINFASAVAFPAGNQNTGKKRIISNVPSTSVFNYTLKSFKPDEDEAEDNNI